MATGAGWHAGHAGWDAMADQVRAYRRTWVRLMALAGLAGLAVFAAATLLIASLFHGSLLLAALLVLGVPVVLLAVLAATAVWIGRRAWRSGAWIEIIPAAAGVPWLGKAGRLGRFLLVGRAFWRAGRRARRPLRSRRGYVQYQVDPDGPWHQARVGDLSGTKR